MSRALNVDATLAEVTARCAKLNAPISAIEALRSGGTRVVLKTAVDAVAVAKAYGTKVMAGTVTRQPMRLRTAPVPTQAAAATRPQWTRD